MSEAKMPVRGEALMVPMRDGVRLSAHVHRPDVAGKFPAIVQYTPYCKGRLSGHHPIVEYGYATVTFDIRGTGDSEGSNDSIYSAQERQDGYDMIEWAAAQPWCNGNVGMWGISFGAVVALQMAGAAPPHLKAIIARSGSDDPYAEWTNPGGQPRPYMYLGYAPIMTASNFAPPDPEVVGERWAEIWRERLEKNVPWGVSFIQNLCDGPFWRERALRGHYDDVKCAVFVVGGWADWYPTPLLRIFAGLKGPKRALIGPWSHQFPDAGLPGPQVDWLAEVLKWFDYWLKGIDNGVMTEPPVTIFVRQYSAPATFMLEDRGTFRCEREWPPIRTVPTPMFLGEARRLSREKPYVRSGVDSLDYDPRIGASTGMHGGGPFNVNFAMPLDQRPDEAVSLAYTSEVLDEDLEVIGQPRAVLHFTSSAPVILLAVKLCDVAPDGTSVLVTKGFLNVAHRDGHEHPSAVEPGRIHEVAIDLLACAYRFEKGHRIRFDIACGDLLNVWPTPMACTSTIHRTAEHASHVILPVTPPQDPALPPPTLKALASPPIQREMLQAPDYCISRDIINETATVQYRCSYGYNWTHEASYTVSAKDPACAVARSSSKRSQSFPGREIVVQAQCVTASDRQAFHHTVEVEITLNGARHFNKSWAVSVLRRLC